MIRDVDLIRQILLRISDHSVPSGSTSEEALDWAPLLARGYELSSIHYHVELLNEAGLIRADELVPGQWWPERLTWEGHEFVDAARDESRWQLVRQRVDGSAGAAPFSLLQKLLLQAASAEIADSPMSSSRMPAKRKK